MHIDFVNVRYFIGVIQNMKKDKILFCLILIIFILIPVIIYFSPLLFKYKFFLLTIIGLVIYFVLRIVGVSNETLGISKKNTLKSLKRNIPIIVIFIIMIFIVKLMGIDRFIPNESFLFYIFYIFVSCPIQEFLYRGLFGYFNQELIKNELIVLFLSSFCYSFVHIIYKDVFTCILTFAMGMIWYQLYKKDKNLIGVSLSHIVLGILTISLGIIN